MGLLDAWSQRAMQRREGRVEFLGEQSGTVDDTLRRDLILEFATRPSVQRAYLAEVRFDPSAPPVAALCIRSDTGEDRSLVVRIGELFRRRFGSDSFLDIVFLTDQQENEIRLACGPFYARATP